MIINLMFIVFLKNILIDVFLNLYILIIILKNIKLFFMFIKNIKLFFMFIKNIKSFFMFIKFMFIKNIKSCFLFIKNLGINIKQSYFYTRAVCLIFTAFLFAILYILLIVFTLRSFFQNEDDDDVSLEKKTKEITPNLTLYYPLQSSILSVSIRFMGTLLLILFFFCINFFSILSIYNINLKIIIIFMLIIIYIIILTAIYHLLNSLSHFIK